MIWIRTATICLAALLFCSECVLSRPLHKRQANQYTNALLSISSGKYVTILNNGSVLATGLPVHGIHDRSSQWYLHSTTKGYRFENVQNRDHCLAVAQRDNVTLLVVHNLSEPFTLEMMLEQDRILSGVGQTQNNTQHNENNFSDNTGSTFSFHSEWKFDFETLSVKLARDDTDCYLSFDQFGYPLDNLCSHPSLGNNLDTIFILETIF